MFNGVKIGAWGLVWTVLLASCATAKNESRPTSSKEATPVGKKPEKKELPSLLGPAPSEEAPGKKQKTGEKIVTYTARFDMDRLAGGKRFQGSILYLDGGRTLLASYRPMKQYFQFVDRRVVVQGFHWSPPPEAQQIMADHFSITSMKLAPGQTPYATKPTSLPSPPLVRTRGELEARKDRWVQVVATLAGGKKPANEAWGVANLVLGDGTAVEASVYWGTYEQRWKSLVGKKVTVTGKAAVKDEGGKKRLLLPGRTAICQGVVDGCGMRPGTGGPKR